jgi:hypothetical protein
MELQFRPDSTLYMKFILRLVIFKQHNAAKSGLQPKNKHNNIGFMMIYNSCEILGLSGYTDIIILPRRRMQTASPVLGISHQTALRHIA